MTQPKPAAGIGRARKHWSDFRTFAQANEAGFWKFVYYSLAALLFLAASWKRFSLPQDPLAVFDAYLLPVLVKLSGGFFAHVQGLTKEGLNFLYSGMIYLILRTWEDFRAIEIGRAHV